MPSAISSLSSALAKTFEPRFPLAGTWGWHFDWDGTMLPGVSPQPGLVHWPSRDFSWTDHHGLLPIVMDLYREILPATPLSLSLLPSGTDCGGSFEAEALADGLRDALLSVPALHGLMDVKWGGVAVTIGIGWGNWTGSEGVDLGWTVWSGSSAFQTEAGKALLHEPVFAERAASVLRRHACRIHGWLSGTRSGEVLLDVRLQASAHEILEAGLRFGSDA